MIVVTAFLAFGGGRPAEFAAPNDERFIQQPAQFQILNKPGNTLIAFAGEVSVAALDVAVACVPRDIVATDGMGQLHHAHATFHQPARDQAAFGELALAVEFLCGRRLA